MDASTSFAHMPLTPEPIIARVRVDLEHLAARLPEAPEVDHARLADEAVRGLWDSRVKVFIGVLAFREARDRFLTPVVPVIPDERST
jgi:hypothetical protein